MKRRKILALASLTGVSSTAGCLNSQDETFATLQALELINEDGSDAVTIELQMEREDGDEVVHEELYELGEGFDGISIDCVWPDEPLTVMVRRTDGDEWNTLSTTDYEDCMMILAVSQPNGVGITTSVEECPGNFAICHDDKTSD